MTLEPSPQSSVDRTTPDPPADTELEAHLLRTLSTISVEDVGDNLVEAGLVDGLSVHEDRVEVRLRPIPPISPKAGGRMHRLWEQVQERLEQDEASGAPVSVKIDWDRPLER